MEIRDRKPIKGAAVLRAATPAQAAPGAQAAPAAAEARDVVEIGGIPDAELTPNVRRALTALMAEVTQLRRQFDEARQRIAHLEKLVDEDPLMPVINRRAFVRELTRMMAFSQRYGVPASIIYFDINNMKRINDAYGHAAGDAVLIAVAKALIENVRTSDVVGRLGGDEIGVLLVQTDDALARRKAAELAGHIEARAVPWQGAEIHASVSYGIYSFAQDDNAGAAIDAADRAMYESKSRRSKDAP
jgi:diguanylate cyclase (GGDEF)-like protein